MRADNLPIKREKLLDALKDTATNLESRNILLAGPWGSGKTALLRGLQDRLKNSDNNVLHVIWFSPWSTVADGDPRLAFLRLLRNEMVKTTRTAPENDNDKGAIKRIGKLLKAFGEILDAQSVQAGLMVALPLVGALAPTIGGMAKLSSVLIENTLDEKESKDKSQIELMRSGVRQMLLDIANYGRQGNGTGRRILLLVDDLDRSRPEEAVAVLDNLYHLLMPHMDDDTDWPLSSVWAVNTTVLEEFLYREYRELPSFDPNAYLEKLFCQRINVPPLIAPLSTNDRKTISDNTSELWRQALNEAVQMGCLRLEGNPDHVLSKLASKLSDEVNYAILGNLRLHARVRRDCVRLWYVLNNGEARDFVRDARLIVLIDAFSYFREQIAPFNGMWPHFLNQINKRLTDRPMEWIANPLYRHVDSPDLHTLLEDLTALQYDETTKHYDINDEGRKRLQLDLIQFWEHGI